MFLLPGNVEEKDNACSVLYTHVLIHSSMGRKSHITFDLLTRGLSFLSSSLLVKIQMFLFPLFISYKYPQ